MSNENFIALEQTQQEIKSSITQLSNTVLGIKNTLDQLGGGQSITDQINSIITEINSLKEQPKVIRHIQRGNIYDVTPNSYQEYTHTLSGFTNFDKMIVIFNPTSLTTINTFRSGYGIIENPRLSNSTGIQSLNILNLSSSDTEIMPMANIGTTSSDDVCYTLQGCIKTFSLTKLVVCPTLVMNDDDGDDHYYDIPYYDFQVIEFY